jgi:hypothetical protein
MAAPTTLTGGCGEAAAANGRRRSPLLANNPGIRYDAPVDPGTRKRPIVQPYAHARASARLARRDWRDDLPIHEFMDVAKHGCPDLRHRTVLHNADLGPELAARTFATLPHARDVALLHVRQDLRRLPTLADWMAGCDVASLPRYRDPATTGPATIARAVDHLGLADPAPVQLVWDMLTLPATFAPAYGLAANALLMNGIGPVIARLMFGPPRLFPGSNGGEVMVDFSWICEGMIVACARHVPALTRVLDCFDGKEPR